MKKLLFLLAIVVCVTAIDTERRHLGSRMSTKSDSRDAASKQISPFYRTELHSLTDTFVVYRELEKRFIKTVSDRSCANLAIPAFK